jgi:hypothetical protein
VFIDSSPDSFVAWGGGMNMVLFFWVVAVACSDASMYGTFTWTVTLPAAPADKDSLADISRFDIFRFLTLLRDQKYFEQK